MHALWHSERVPCGCGKKAGKDQVWTLREHGNGKALFREPYAENRCPWFSPRRTHVLRKGRALQHSSLWERPGVRKRMIKRVLITILLFLTVPMFYANVVTITVVYNNIPCKKVSCAPGGWLRLWFMRVVPLRVTTSASGSKPGFCSAGISPVLSRFSNTSSFFTCGSISAMKENVRSLR